MKTLKHIRQSYIADIRAYGEANIEPCASEEYGNDKTPAINLEMEEYKLYCAMDAASIFDVHSKW